MYLMHWHLAFNPYDDLLLFQKKCLLDNNKGDRSDRTANPNPFWLPIGYEPEWRAGPAKSILASNRLEEPEWQAKYILAEYRVSPNSQPKWILMRIGCEPEQPAQILGAPERLSQMHLIG